VLHHVAQPPRIPSDRPPLLVLLHGYGSNEQDLVGLAPQLDGRFQVVSLRAPVPMGGPAFAWFPLQFTERGIVADTETAKASCQALIEELPRLVEQYGTDPARVYLAGFSQGAIMSASLALNAPRLIAGATLMSGRVMPEMVPGEPDLVGLTGMPVLVVHGTYDEVLPIDNGRASRDLLSKLPVDLTYREYPMAHTVSPESLALVADWLKARLDGPARS
jgi:phospholipase/carboxylesterase